MKVLHITPSYEPAWHLGGVVRSLSQLCRGLVRQGVEVTVYTTDSGQNRRMPVPVNRPVELEGVKVYYFKTDFSLKFAYSKALKQACRQRTKDFDIVHVTSFWCYPAIAAISGARQSRVPYLVSVHGTLRKAALEHKVIKKWLYFNLVERRNIQGAAAIHYTTDMERTLDSFHGFRNPSFIIPNGLDIREFQEIIEPSQAKKAWGINPDSQVITFLGRIAPVKALDLLIKAVSYSSLKEKDLHVLIAGPDAGARGTLQQLVKDLGLEARVRFLGEVDPKNRNILLAASDILALVSTDENFGYAAVEAMLAGVPVLVSEHVGLCQNILADGGGVVVPLQVEAIARAMGQMLSDPQRLKAMGRAAASAARRRYDINIVAQKMAKAYEDILLNQRSTGLSWSDFEG